MSNLTLHFLGGNGGQVGEWMGARVLRRQRASASNARDPTSAEKPRYLYSSVRQCAVRCSASHCETPEIRYEPCCARRSISPPLPLPLPLPLCACRRVFVQVARGPSGCAALLAKQTPSVLPRRGAVAARWMRARSMRSRLAGNIEESSCALTTKIQPLPTTLPTNPPPLFSSPPPPLPSPRSPLHHQNNSHPNQLSAVAPRNRKAFRASPRQSAAPFHAGCPTHPLVYA